MPNYTGPYISNGKFQTSVEFGEVEPLDVLDSFSRLHDSAYAKWEDSLHRTVADKIYYDSVKNLSGLFPEIASDVVLYGNRIGRSVSNIASSIATYGPLGIVVGGVKNMYDLYSYMSESSSGKIRKEILNYYATDPYPQYQVDGDNMNKRGKLGEASLGRGGTILPGDVDVYNPHPAAPGLKLGSKIGYQPVIDVDESSGPVHQPIEYFSNRGGNLVAGTTVGVYNPNPSGPQPPQESYSGFGNDPRFQRYYYPTDIKLGRRRRRNRRPRPPG